MRRRRPGRGQAEPSDPSRGLPYEIATGSSAARNDRISAAQSYAVVAGRSISIWRGLARLLAKNNYNWDLKNLECVVRIPNSSVSKFLFRLVARVCFELATCSPLVRGIKRSGRRPWGRYPRRRRDTVDGAQQRVPLPASVPGPATSAGPSPSPRSKMLELELEHRREDGKKIATGESHPT